MSAAITIDLSDESEEDNLPDVYLPSSFPSHSQSGKTTSSASSTQNSQKEQDISLDKQQLKNKAFEEQQVVRQVKKIYKPGECMKYMIIEMHPKLLDSWYCADVSREVISSGAKINSNTQLCDYRLVLWNRIVEPTLCSNNGIVNLTSSKEPCEHGLYVASLEDMEEYLETQSLSQHMNQVASLAGCKVTLVLCAVKDYFKSNGRKNKSSKRKIEPINLEMALTDLLVSANCDTITVNTPNELALTIAQFTKAIAEAPYKKAKRAYDEQADFYMRGDNKKCVALSKNGDGVGMLWQQMIAVLPQSSLETARAICGKYKSPLMLQQALQEPDSVNTVGDVGVSRSAAPGSKARRLGNEFARKLHILFTADDGDTLIE